MSSYPDPALRGDVYPSEEEIDPTGVGPDPQTDAPLGAYPQAGPVVGAYPAPSPAPGPAPRPAPGPVPAPSPGPAPRPPVESHSIVTHHLDGSTEVVTDLDGDGVPDITYLDSDRDGRLDTVVRDPRPTG
ncbi:hypothetical protein AB0B88_25895 [Micromonospora haikouensis]|uniref:hypothetical protein n=1 Tax=Micromonospora haikouensis TaxID=686309 RepID=UPI0033D0F774